LVVAYGELSAGAFRGEKDMCKAEQELCDALAQYVWCAPALNESLAEVWVDRVVLVPVECNN